MSLWRRPSGVYESHIMVDGVRYRKSTGTTNKRLAERIDQKHQEELLAKRFQVEEHEFNPAMKFSELATRFLAAGSKPWHRERLNIILPFFAGMEINHIRKNVIDRYRAHRHSQKKITESTINHDLQCIRHMLYWAVDQGFLPDNPLKRLQLAKARRKKRPVMSFEDEEKLLQALADHQKNITICGLDTGMRRGEILSQLWEDVDFPRRVLFVTHSKTAGGESREIPLTKRFFALLSVLSWWIEDNAAAEGFNRWTINEVSYPMANTMASASFHLKEGKRYRIRMRNASDDIHPIHLHRHSFELTNIGGKSTAGIMKDVVMLGGYQELAVDFIANNPGLTLFHCHQQLHMDFGFMMLFDYV